MRNIFTKKLMQLKTDWRSFCDTNRIEINNSQDRVELDRSTSLAKCKDNNETGHEIPGKDRFRFECVKPFNPHSAGLDSEFCVKIIKFSALKIKKPLS